MINGAGDRESHTRRLKTKLIAMKMRGVNRVIMEPSGIYDVDEFFDILHEEPLNQWYKIGNVVAILLQNSLNKRVICWQRKFFMQVRSY